MAEKRKAGRPFGTKRVNPETATEQNASFVVNKDLLKKIKLLVQAESFRQTVEAGQMVNVKLKDVINEALNQYVTNYEKKHGTL